MSAFFFFFLSLLLVGSAELRSPVRLPPPSAPGEAHPGRPAVDEGPGGDLTTAGLRANSSSTPTGWPWPLGEASPRAYALMPLALVLFSVGMVSNLALMCTVWHNVYLQSTWNCTLAGMALLDFGVLFFCLPVVVFHELTSRRLLGEASCRLVPYLEVTSLGVATFSLCALSMDRLRAPGPTPEPCRPILSKMAVVWLGSLTLAAPELPLWRLRRQAATTTTAAADLCEPRPSERLPDPVYSLLLTYGEARPWWILGCYVCLPLLFTLGCDLLARRVAATRPAEAVGSASCPSPTKKEKRCCPRDPRLRSTLAWLTALYVACGVAGSACGLAAAYVPTATTASLAGHFFLFARCAATPVLLLCSCRRLGRAFLGCCCCCRHECRPRPPPSTPPSLTPSPKKDVARHASPAIGTPC
ncbi:G-protein coupled receptor 37-like 1 [Stigmatopora argus]